MAKKPAAPVTNGSPAQGTVTVQPSKDGDPITEQQHLTVPPVDGPVADVYVQMGVTVNLGSYESARIDVALRYPCAANQAAVNETFERVKSWCGERVKDEVRKIRKGG